MTGLDPRSAENQRARLDDLRPQPKGLILDVDGVLWRDTVPIGDLASIFASISDRGLRLAVATNNAVNHPAYATRCIQLANFGYFRHISTTSA